MPTPRSNRPLRLLCSVILTFALCAQQLPPATFSGAVRGISKKRITIETSEGNFLEFDITGKTRAFRGKKKIQPDSLQVGETVKIEAKQEPSFTEQILEALTITAGT